MVTETRTITRSSIGLRSERGPILLSLMLSTALVAIDSTIISTAVPSVVHSLGGFSQFPWLFSIYLLAQAVSVPVYGKLADLFGRKPLMLFGIGLFLLGSILAGAAWSMPALIAFRAVQGLGAGAIQPMSMTITGDIYTLQERSKAQGYLASVWGISAVVGPTLGGVFSEWVSWRWIFFVNIPLCLLAAWMLMRNFHERVERKQHRIDYVGAASLTIGCSLLILGLLEGGQAWAWNSAAGISVFVAGAALLVVFVIAQLRVAEPVLPLWVFRRRILVATSVSSLVVGAITLGLTSYVATFAQSSLGAGPLLAGFTLAPLTIGWPLASALCGRLYLAIGFRATAVIGAAVTIGGTVMLAVLGVAPALWLIGVACFVIGCGLGLVAVPTLIAAQTSVGWAQRGVVTGNNMFYRSIGSAVGVAVFGAIANSTLRTALGGASNGGAVAVASHHVFLLVAVFAAAMLVAVALVPRSAAATGDDATNSTADVPAGGGPADKAPAARVRAQPALPDPVPVD